MADVADLSPNPLWRFFHELCEIPRPSKHEEAVRHFVETFAKERGLHTHIDSAGNLIVVKPATPGMENSPGVILQCHLDMVPQKNSDTQHDFLTDPIRPYIDGDWVTAEGTTLGADNGIGVAATMAILDSTDISHGPVEALFTVDEESGMGGARGLEAGVLRGSVMLNLDSEDEGELYVGCAGGVDVAVTGLYSEESAPDGSRTAKLILKGLKGGHSGVDIILERGNANKLMVRLLKALAKEGVRLSSFQGGTLRNAIPREAEATVVIPEKSSTAVSSLIDHYSRLFADELAEVESGLSISATDTDSAKTVMSASAQTLWLNTLHAAPCGIHRMSSAMKGVVETSNNLAVVRIGDGAVTVENMVRSLRDSAREEHAEVISGLFALTGAQVECRGAYPGWTPNRNSEILKVMSDVHQELFNKKPEIRVIHAGLECGLLGGVYPNWDMISFGPTIRYPHSPDERVHIPAVANFWHLLSRTLESIR